MKSKLRKQNITQLIIALVIIFLVNYIASKSYFRMDLTTDKRYTLSDATKEILDSLNDVVYIEVYLDGEMPIGFQRMEKAINELMEEFHIVAGENIQYMFINPSESNDQDKRNAIYKDLYDRGLEPTNVKDRDKEGGSIEKILFPGAIISYNNFETPINLLVNNPGFSAEQNLNNSIQSLEYKFIDAIKKITNKQRKKIAFIEGQGELDEYYTGDITRSLNEYYDIDRVTIKESLNILDTYDAIIIAGPTEPYSEKSKLIIDQYIMNGGKVLWFVESVKVNMDSLATGSVTFALVNDVNLGDQLFKYGVRINPNAIQDIQCAVIPVNTSVAGKQAKFAPAPWLYSPLLLPPSTNPITKNLNMIKSDFPSQMDSVGGKSEIKKQILLTSSANSRIISAPFIVSLNQVREQIDPLQFNQSNVPVAFLLSGEFESVFKNRPVDYITGENNYHLKEKSKVTQMIVVSDADIIRNDVHYRTDGVYLSPLGYDRYSKQTFGNREFVMNAVHYLIGDKGILDLRSREFKLRILDKAKVLQHRVKWQWINTLLPVLVILLFGLLMNFLRKRKYSK